MYATVFKGFNRCLTATAGPHAGDLDLAHIALDQITLGLDQVKMFAKFLGISRWREPTIPMAGDPFMNLTLDAADNDR